MFSVISLMCVYFNTKKNRNWLRAPHILWCCELVFGKSESFALVSFSETNSLTYVRNSITQKLLCKSWMVLEKGSRRLSK